MEPPRPDEPQSDDGAWAEVVRRWDDEDAHRRFLARRPDLEGLADAGRRYKAVLDERPGDPIAQRWRDEVLKRATAVAFAQLPRTKAPDASSLKLRRAAAVGAVLLFVAVIAWLGLRLASLSIDGGAR